MNRGSGTRHHPCPQCGAPTPSDRECCSRQCANKHRPQRRTSSTGKPCPCGSGLVGRLITLPQSTYYGVACAKCKVMLPPPPAQPSKYGSTSGEQDKRNAAARRALEARRDARIGQGDAW